MVLLVLHVVQLVLTLGAIGLLVQRIRAVNQVIASLSRAAELASGVAVDLKANVDVSRAEFARLVVLLDEMHALVTVGGATGLRIEADAHLVADELGKSQHRADEVAGRAGSTAGEAADIASQSAPRQKGSKGRR